MFSSFKIFVGEATASPRNMRMIPSSPLLAGRAYVLRAYGPTCRYAAPSPLGRLGFATLTPRNHFVISS